MIYYFTTYYYTFKLNLYKFEFFFSINTNYYYANNSTHKII